MKKYRVREGSIIDYFRYGMAGLVFGAIIGIVINTSYPMKEGGAMEYIAVPKDLLDEINEKLDRIQRMVERPDPPPELGQVLSAEKVAQMLGVTKRTVYTWAREGKIRSVRTGGRVLFPDSAVEEFMKGGMT